MRGEGGPCLLSSLITLITYHSSLITHHSQRRLSFGRRQGRRVGGAEAGGGAGRGAERGLPEGAGAVGLGADADRLRGGDDLGRDGGEAGRRAVVLLASRHRD